jgi:hypothetical protein
MPHVSEAESAANEARLMQNMASALAMLAHPDAEEASLLDYVFAYDPQQDLAVLSRPDALDSASVFSISESAIDVGAPASPRGDDDDDDDEEDGGGGGGGTAGCRGDSGGLRLCDAEFLVDFLLIPAACHGVFSYGVVCRRRRGVLPGCPSTGRPADVRDEAVCRYCRNEATGELFIVDHDLDGGGQTHVAYRKDMSSTNRVLMKTSFDTLALQKRGERGRELDFVGAARMQAMTLQNRFCPVCNSPPSRKCGCVLPLTPPRHAHDLAALAANSDLMFGNFVGEVHLTAFCGLVGKFFAKRMMSRMDTNPKLMSVQPAALHQTCIQLRLAAANPLMLELPFLDSDGELLLTPESVDSVLEISGSKVERADSDLKFIFPTDPLADESDIDFVLSAGSSISDPRPLDLQSVASGSSEFFPLSKDFEAPYSSADAGELLLPWPVDDDIKQSISDLFSPLLSDFSEGAVDKSVTELSAVSPPASSQATSSNDERNLEQERTARMELRRQKNRAAAARSNARRKERNESLRRNLAYVRERVQVLRGTEKVLLEDNISLKLQLRKFM